MKVAYPCLGDIGVADHMFSASDVVGLLKSWDWM